MLISKMIEELEQLKETNGDVEIYFNSEIGVVPVETISRVRVGFSKEDSEVCLAIF